MRTLREAIGEFARERKAIGHFNFSDSNQLKAIALASKETGLPVIAGLSEGEREYFPLSHARALVDRYRAEGVEVYLNADHTYSFEKARAAIDAGVDSIVVDGARLPFKENSALLKRVVAYSHEKDFFGVKKRVIVEGELGYIGTSSSLHDALPEGVSPEQLTAVADAQALVEETNIDCFAPAVGNIHGMLKGAAEPRLHPERVEEISRAVHIPLVLHGASGNTTADIRACIGAGVAIVHINTELRLLYRSSLAEEFATAPEESTPYKFLAPPVRAMQAFLSEKMRLFANVA